MTTPKVVEAYIQYKGKKYPAGSSLEAQKGDKLQFQIKIKNMGSDGGWGGVQIWDTQSGSEVAWRDVQLSPYGEAKTTIEIVADHDRVLGIAAYSCESAHTNCTQTDWYGNWNIRVIGESVPPSTPSSPNIPLEYLALGAGVGVLAIGLIFMEMERQRMMEMLLLARK